MRYGVPHPIPYQGSKRRLASAILAHIPPGRFSRLVEPFAGSAAVTLAAARGQLFKSYLIGDFLEPLALLWQGIIDEPEEITNGYEELWDRERRNPIAEYYKVRNEFNADRHPTKLLYLLARCVKNAVRFNPSGEFNQSPDKRRRGTSPSTMRAELFSAHRLLNDHATSRYSDFRQLLASCVEGDLVYLDPPYQGTSEGRDQRYISGVSRKDLIEALEALNEKRIPFILSYDGFCGDKEYGAAIPLHVAERLLLEVGRSSQSTLNGGTDQTIESLYVSHSLALFKGEQRFSINHFSPQAQLFANA
jgi:DNA adenine methylase